MKARLLVLSYNMQQVPAMPSLLLQIEHEIVLYSQGWTKFVKQGTLGELTVDDLRSTGLIEKGEAATLSDVRELPDDDLMSPQTLQRLRQWWHESVSDIPKPSIVAKAS